MPKFMDLIFCKAINLNNLEAGFNNAFEIM